jgi:hypothetical protein
MGRKYKKNPACDRRKLGQSGGAESNQVPSHYSVGLYVCVACCQVFVPGVPERPGAGASPVAVAVSANSKTGDGRGMALTVTGNCLRCLVFCAVLFGASAQQQRDGGPEQWQ